MDKELDKLSNQPLSEAKKELLLKVKAKVAEGVTVTRACRDLGYPRSSYYVDLAKLEGAAA